MLINQKKIIEYSKKNVNLNIDKFKCHEIFKNQLHYFSGKLHFFKKRGPEDARNLFNGVPNSKQWD